MHTFALPDVPESYRITHAFHVIGDSMSPRINEGTTILCEPVESPAYTNYSRRNIYVIHYRGCMVAVKYLRNDQERGEITLISENADVYPEFTIRHEDINHIWLAKTIYGPI
jgi:phage repressor protein C with HTH and peptisase S24 domain